MKPSEILNLPTLTTHAWWEEDLLEDLELFPCVDILNIQTHTAKIINDRAITVETRLRQTSNNPREGESRVDTISYHKTPFAILFRQWTKGGSCSPIVTDMETYHKAFRHILSYVSVDNIPHHPEDVDDPKLSLFGDVRIVRDANNTLTMVPAGEYAEDGTRILNCEVLRSNLDTVMNDAHTHNLNAFDDTIRARIIDAVIAAVPAGIDTLRIDGIDAKSSEPSENDLWIAAALRSPSGEILQVSQPAALLSDGPGPALLAINGARPAAHLTPDLLTNIDFDHGTVTYES